MSSTKKKHTFFSWISIYKAFLFLSIIVFVLTFSPVSIQKQKIYFLVGIFAGCTVCASVKKRDLSWGMIIACSIISLFVFSNISYSSFIVAVLQSKTQLILEKMISVNLEGTRLLKCISALPFFPLTFFVVSRIVLIVVSARKRIDYKLIEKELLKDNQLYKELGLSLFSLLMAALVGTGLLLSVYSLPLDSIEQNMQKSASTIADEGGYPTLFPWCQSMLDNYTDSIMLLEAADHVQDRTLDKAMLVYHGTIKNKNPYEVIVEHYLNGTEFDQEESYARYWHGYLVFLKPLLTIMDYGSIRVLNGILQVFLFLMVCCLLVKKNQKEYLVPVVLSYLMIMPIALMNSLQFSSCYYIYTLGMIGILILPEDKQRFIYLVFLYIGIFTAYFDFLTYPIATFGMPAAVYLVLRKKETTEKKIIDLIRNGFFWCFGYVGMWSLKWIVAWIITGENVINEAASAISLRTSSALPEGGKLSRIECVNINFQALLDTPVTWVALLFVLYLLLKNKKIKDLSFEDKRVFFPYLFLGLLPVIWFVIVGNHSSIHYWFTNKACIVTLSSFLFAVSEYCNLKKHTV